MKNQDLRNVTQLNVMFCFRFLAAFLAFVLVLRIKLTYFKVFLQTFVQRSFALHGKTAKRFEGQRLKVATAALHDTPLDACENLIDHAWVRCEVLLVDLAVWSILVLRGHISIKLLNLRRRFLILQATQQMHQKLMTVVLHGWEKLFSNQVFKSSGIEH